MRALQWILLDSPSAYRFEILIDAHLQSETNNIGSRLELGTGRVVMNLPHHEGK